MHHIACTFIKLSNWRIPSVLSASGRG